MASPICFTVTEAASRALRQTRSNTPPLLPETFEDNSLRSETSSMILGRTTQVASTAAPHAWPQAAIIERIVSGKLSMLGGVLVGAACALLLCACTPAAQNKPVQQDAAVPVTSSAAEPAAMPSASATVTPTATATVAATEPAWLTDSRCRASDYCKSAGTCLAGKDHCVAGDDDDCRRSGVCKKRGSCSSDGKNCVAKRAEDCARSTDCKQQGECALNGGHCLTSQVGCTASQSCRDYGRCHMLDGARGHKCAPRTAADCRASTACKERGACSLRPGPGCNVGEMFCSSIDAAPLKRCGAVSDTDCRRSAACRKRGLCKARHGACVVPSSR